MGFFRRAELTYAWALSSSIACLLTRTLGAAGGGVGRLWGRVCCQRGLDVGLSGGNLAADGEVSREVPESDVAAFGFLG